MTDVYREIIESATGGNHPEAWEAFRQAMFPYDRINLNPGCLGSCSEYAFHAVCQAMKQDAGFPLRRYENGRKWLHQLRARVTETWPAPEHLVAFPGSTSHTMSLLTSAIARAFRKFSGQPVRVLSTESEHEGGIGGFHLHPDFEVKRLENSVWEDEKRLRAAAGPFQPDVVFLSTRSWLDGHALPLTRIAATLRAQNPALLLVADAAQSLGFEPLDFSSADIIVASGHKWLFGPEGSGLLWLRPAVAERLPDFYPAGALLAAGPAARFEPTGGQDFSRYAGLLAAVELYAAAGPERIFRRTCKLRAAFSARLRPHLPAGIQLIENGPVAALEFGDRDGYRIYSELNDRGMHAKYIRHPVEGGGRRLLRFGFPYYESVARVQTFAAAVLNALKMAGQPDGNPA